MAVSPKAVTLTSVFSALSHLVFLYSASVSDLPVSLPSLDVFANLSASNGTPAQPQLWTSMQTLLSVQPNLFEQGQFKRRR